MYRCRLQRRSQAVAAFGLIVLTVSAGSALAQSTPEVAAWLEHEHTSAIGYPEPGLVAIRFDELFHPELSDPELSRLRTEVAGKPDHPGHNQILTEERRRSSGPDIREWTIWTIAPGEWRINQNTRSLKELPFVDRVRRGNDAWMLTTDYLGVIDAAKPPPGRDIGSSEGMLKMHLSELFFAKLGAGAIAEAGFSDITAGQGRWSATRWWGPAERRGAYRFEGRWDAAAGRGFVEQRTLTETPAKDAIGTRIVYSDWRRNETLNRWVCLRIDTYKPSGRLHESLVFRDAIPFTQDEFDTITRPPDPIGSDPLRGTLTVRKYNDFRASPAKWHEITDGRVVGSGELALASRREEFPWRRVGWGLAVVVLTTLIVLRIRRS